MKSESEHVYGVHPVLELLQAGQRRVETILLLASKRPHRGVQQIVDLATYRQITITSVAAAELRQLVGHDRHQGVAALVAPVAYRPFADVVTGLRQRPGPHTLLALDGVTDVGNFATLIRSAAAFGVDAMLLPRHHSVGLTPAVSKRSAGAVERMAFVQVGNLVRALETLQQLGCWLYGAEAQGEALMATVAWPERTVLVMGAEGRGLRRLVRERCDQLVRIPMREGNNSLNVAVAGSIILSHIWAYREMQGGVNP
ncbi:MAG: 23S rRNA (guanosine-2'-O-)-methyltransferase [Candidatus Entotheonella factor]|uniref:23S rRNA (Guanosine-2'-O-)-methyltransferase n=1 Tax=Entotheonella factor TaxID=1429438 RepID=W4LSK4_ENTF1|nr:23S rRNA (guanosine(2251)-2'-O)-methyltransferase RlmB [Candidatus Entotheonella palauensis]ETX00948.1 MAG: 23S rRNA (guanosine-2'-O-)-methyltransferase [Candidatus Entotheonella factor]